MHQRFFWSMMAWARVKWCRETVGVEKVRVQDVQREVESNQTFSGAER
jgi:hypothetical protein